MDEPIIAEVDANVGYRSTVCVEEHEIPRTKTINHSLTDGIQF